MRLGAQKGCLSAAKREEASQGGEKKVALEPHLGLSSGSRWSPFGRGRAGCQLDEELALFCPLDTYVL